MSSLERIMQVIEVTGDLFGERFDLVVRWRHEDGSLGADRYEALTAAEARQVLDDIGVTVSPF